MSDVEYASRARGYYQDFLPSRYQQIPNPEHFFTDLGQRIEDQVQTEPDEESEKTTAMVGLLNDWQQAVWAMSDEAESTSAPPRR